MHSHNHKHTPIIINRAVGSEWRPVVARTGHWGRHPGCQASWAFLFQGSSQIARCCQCRVEDPGDSPGGHLERLSPIHVLRGRVTDRHVPYTESAHRNKKRNKTNIPDVIAWLKLGPGQIQQLSSQIGLKEGRGPRCSVQYR